MQGTQAHFDIRLADGFGNVLGPLDGLDLPASLKLRADHMWHVEVRFAAVCALGGLNRTASDPAVASEALEFSTERVSMTGPIRVRYTPRRAGLMQLHVHFCGGSEGCALA